jgi:hypothetical protein
MENLPGNWIDLAIKGVVFVLTTFLVPWLSHKAAKFLNEKSKSEKNQNEILNEQKLSALLTEGIHYAEEKAREYYKKNKEKMDSEEKKKISREHIKERAKEDNIKVPQNDDLLDARSKAVLNRERSNNKAWRDEFKDIGNIV